MMTGKALPICSWTAVLYMCYLYQRW